MVRRRPGLPRHPASAPTRTPPWSTASACSAGASAASRPRPRCSASRSRCSSRASSASSCTGELPAGTTATDLVLTITEMLRKHGVVGKFVEFYGEGVAATAARQPRHHRQHVAGVRLHRRDLPDRRRDDQVPQAHRPLEQQLALVEAYAKEQGLWLDPAAEPRLLREAGARPLHGRPLASPARSARRTASSWPTPSSASAGRAPTTSPTTRRRGDEQGRVLPGLRLPGRPRVRRATARRGAQGPRSTEQPGHGDPRDGTSSRSTTAPSRSPRSPPAPTPRTRTSWSPPRWWPRRPSRRA